MTELRHVNWFRIIIAVPTTRTSEISEEDALRPFPFSTIHGGVPRKKEESRRSLRAPLARNPPTSATVCDESAMYDARVQKKRDREREGRGRGGRREGKEEEIGIWTENESEKEERTYGKASQTTMCRV